MEKIEEAPPDAILGLTAAFRSDPRPEKINLGVGIYYPADLKATLMGVVKKAEEKLAKKGLTRTYLPIDGDPEYVQMTRRLVLGDHKAYGAQTVGATGALKIVSDFLRLMGKETIYLPNPTWANHQNIFSDLEIKEYPHMDLACIPDGSPLLLHACCQNPSGIDPRLGQWEEIVDIVRARNLIPVIDCAYLGLGDGLEEDGRAIRLFAENGIEGFVTYSYAKNMGLYGERAGALFVLGENPAIGSQVRRLIRRTWSTPPAHAAFVVKFVLSELRSEWEKELEGMRKRLKEMRHALEEAEVIDEGGKGLFSLLGIDKDQVNRLREEFAIFMPASGRINVAGLNKKNLPTVVEAIRKVK